MSALDDLADEEEAILREVASVHGTMEDKHARLEELGVHARYRAVLRGYLDLTDDRESGREALQRAVFLVWHEVAEPSCFSGVSGLPDEDRRRALAALDSICADAAPDEELRRMLAWYHRVADHAFSGLGDLPHLAAVLRAAVPDVGAESLPDPSCFDGRGQMGRYWTSVVTSRAARRR